MCPRGREICAGTAQKKIERPTLTTDALVYNGRYIKYLQFKNARFNLELRYPNQGRGEGGG